MDINYLFLHELSVLHLELYLMDLLRHLHFYQYIIFRKDMIQIFVVIIDDNDDAERNYNVELFGSSSIF